MDSQKGSKVPSSSLNSERNSTKKASSSSRNTTSTTSSSQNLHQDNTSHNNRIIDDIDRSSRYLNFMYWNGIKDHLLFHALISLSGTIMRYHIIESGTDQSPYSVIFSNIDRLHQKLELNLLRNRQITLSQLINYLDIVIVKQKSIPDLNIIHSLIISSITFQISCLIEDSTLTSYIQVHKGVIALLQIFFESSINRMNIDSNLDSTQNERNSKVTFLRFYSSEIYDYVTTIFIPPYDPSAFQEILSNLLEFEKLFDLKKNNESTNKLKVEFDNLCNFIRDLLPILDFKKENISKYPRSVIFSLLKKWYKIFPPKSFKMIDLNSNDLTKTLVLYYQLVALYLNHALPECEYLFTLTFYNYQIQENFANLYNNLNIEKFVEEDATLNDGLSKHIIYVKRFITFLNKRENFYRSHLYLKRPFFDTSVFDKEKNKILSIKKPTYNVKETFIKTFNVTIIKPNNYPHYESAIYRTNYSNFIKGNKSHHTHRYNTHDYSHNSPATPTDSHNSNTKPLDNHTLNKNNKSVHQYSSTDDVANDGNKNDGKDCKNKGSTSMVRKTHKQPPTNLRQPQQTSSKINFNLFRVDNSMKIKDNFLTEYDFDPINDKNYDFKFFSEEITLEHLNIIASDRKGIIIEP